MFWLQILMLPLVGALIGWLTNLLAVKLLFRPYEPVKIPGLPLVIQGLLPKRRHDFARSIGETVEAELLTFEDLVEQIHTTEMTARLSVAISGAVREAVMARTPAIIPGSMKKLFAGNIADLVEELMPDIVNWVVKKIAVEARDEIKIGQMVEERMNAFNLEHLERVVFRVASREIKHITVLGGVLGFLIGLFQALFLYFSMFTSV